MASRNSSSIASPPAEQIELTAVMLALSDPVRLGIVAALDEYPGDVACGTFELPVAKSTSSHHFRALREAGVLRQYDEGARRLNQLRRADLDARFPGLLDLVLREGRAVPVAIRER